MTRSARGDQIRRAEKLLKLHEGPGLLLLLNIWDPIGAILLESLGYPAVATASAAVAWSLGRDDGERIPFEMMLDAIGRVASSVDIPVSADIESGFAEEPEAVAENARRVLETGAVGINLEDSRPGDGSLYSSDEQCARLEAVRRVAEGNGIPLVINARIDLFMRAEGSGRDQVTEAIARGRAYREAGADCLYPILVDDLDTLVTIRQATGCPINVFAQASAPSIRRLEAAGIERLSLGPGLLKAALGRVREVAIALREGGEYASFIDGALPSDEVERLVKGTSSPGFPRSS